MKPLFERDGPLLGMAQRYLLKLSGFSGNAFTPGPAARETLHLENSFIAAPPRI
jgi:hypothetical protein